MTAKKTAKKKTRKKAAELILEKGDRVRRKDGKDFFAGSMIGVVDSELYDTRQGKLVFVRTSHGGFCNSGSEYVAELEKIEDYTITVNEFFGEMSHWLLGQQLDAEKIEVDAKVGETYSLVMKKMLKLMDHIGF